jgi:RNA polymerase sigma factor (sigma-70 family)
MATNNSIEEQVLLARAGNDAALEAVINYAQPLVYNLALRMLWQPADAEDAMQEVLIKVITHLSQFRAESSFATWVYRIATNHLLNLGKRRAATKTLTFDTIGDELAPTATTLAGAADLAETVEQELLAEEIRRRCTLGMLLCLDRNLRLVFILAVWCELTSAEGAYVLDITEASFRKRLSRARSQLREFMEGKCSLVNAAPRCACLRQLERKSPTEQVMLSQVLAANPLGQLEMPVTITLQQRVAELSDLDPVEALYRSHPSYNPMVSYADRLKQLIANGKFDLL